jgi:two-component system sensor histidine kinase UhpB
MDGGGGKGDAGRMSQRTGPVSGASDTAVRPARSLFRRIVLINGLVFTLATLVLAVSPATVSPRVRLTEIPVLTVSLFQPAVSPR